MTERFFKEAGEVFGEDFEEQKQMLTENPLMFLMLPPNEPEDEEQEEEFDEEDLPDLDEEEMEEYLDDYPEEVDLRVFSNVEEISNEEYYRN